MENLSSMDNQFLTKVYQFIEDNLSDERFSVEDLAQHAGLSRSMLHRKLIKLTGKSATDLITEKRLLRAKEMLQNDVATASEIAYKVGFNSPSYFNKVFKNYFQVSPGDIRKGVAPIPLSPEAAQQTKSETVPQKRIHAKWAFLILALILPGIAITGMYFLFHEEKPVEKSIAILPFDDISSNGGSQYFADGIVEDLLNRISQIEGLKVISRTSSEMFRDKGSKTIPEIAELLGVNYILEGTVQRESDNVRINIQLIDANKDDHILSQQYDRNLSAIFKLQSEIAAQIASELSIVLNDQQAISLKQNQTNNLKAFEYKQLGRYHLNKRTREGLFTSVKYFRLAIKEDPNYALAYAELADSYFILPWYGHLEWKKGRDSAFYLARKALELDSELGEAHTILGAVYNEFDWKQDAARVEFIKAIQSKPNHSPAHQYYSEYLCTMGNLKEAREELNKAVLLDPYSYVIRYANSQLYLNEGNYDQALAENRICQELVKDHTVSFSLEFKIYFEMKNEAAALESYKKLGKINREWTPGEVDSVYNIGGLNGILWWQLNDGKWDHEMKKAFYYARLGEDEKALELLELAVNEKKLNPFYTTSTDFKNLRSNPRFIAIRKKMGLPPL